MKLDCYFDFTCEYSYRLWLWFERLNQTLPDLEVHWRPFVLKEINREAGEPSPLERSTIESVAVLALALGEAMASGPHAGTYREQVFEAMHRGKDRPDREQLLAIAARAGLDISRFHETSSTWLDSVRASHEAAVSERGIFGTPTLVFSDAAVIFLKLSEVPSEARDLPLWEDISYIALGAPEVAELKRPNPN